MKVIRADILGFCSGVRGAVNSADQVLTEQNAGRSFSLGPLIHNPIVLDSFEKRGLSVIDEGNFDALSESDTVIIRAHGISPDVLEKLQRTGCRIVNATCPLVKLSQKRAADYASKDYNIIFAGDKNHGEVIGIEGYALEAAKGAGLPARFFLIKDENELQSVLSQDKFDRNKKTVLLSQTTFSIAVFSKIQDILRQSVPDFECVNSICPATYKRQQALEKLCSAVDSIIVIGGKTSANTKRLLATAQKLCKKAVLIESAAEIPEEFFSFETVGLTAGASTPDAVIDDVEKLLIDSSRS